MKLTSRIQFSNKAIHISPFGNCLGEGINPSFLLPARDQLQNRQEFVSLTWKAVLKENSEFKHRYRYIGSQRERVHFMLCLTGFKEGLSPVVVDGKTSSLIISNNSSHSTEPLDRTNIVYMFKCSLGDCVSNENNTYVGLTTTTLSERLTMPLNDSNYITLYLRSHSLPKSKFRKILDGNTKKLISLDYIS